MADTYICAMCGKTFEKGRTDDEAIEELHELFGNIPLDECDIICDDCFEQIRPDRPVIETSQIKDTYRYLSGQSQGVPDWLYRLPDFFRPIYQGEPEFKWLGITIPAESAFIGDTLFMHWRREIMRRWGRAAGRGKSDEHIQGHAR